MEGIEKRSGKAKVIAGLLVVGAVVALLYKLKADQTYLSSPIGNSWKWGTSNHELMAAIEADDAARMKSLLPAVPRKQIRPDFVLSLARDDRKECLEVALDAGWSPDGAKSDGGPLLRAVGSGQLDAAKILLDHHARLDVASFGPQSPLSLAVAAKRKPVEALELLRRYGAKTEKYNLLGPAIEVGNLDVARLLIERYGAKPQDGLSEAFSRTWVEPSKEAVDFVGYLLDKGADPNALLNGRPPLFEVVVYTGQFANQKAREEAPMLVSLLLAHGARPDDVGRDVLPHDISTPTKLIDATPLFFFAANGNAPCVKLLLAHGADPIKKASNGQTPLDVAVDPCKELLRQAIRAK